MASEASVLSCFPNFYPHHLDEGLEPVQPKEVWYMGPLEHKPNRIVDITPHLPRKIHATLCHGSSVILKR